ncbi:hypothetical protein PIROE2DRAFT_59418 [Piromyces sp. E2]|nr:hypothetical protein PIROE2DRAFT_59418 [Piromyces sp. E2]|eukprot:OUM66387.1 hypothetical protein PIROE2DRAFT_59418 [Piromyces sp. E2]
MLNDDDDDDDDDDSNLFQFQFNWNTPLCSAIANNKFIISNVLLEHGASINYTRNIIKYLYDENSLNTENLKYILNKTEYNKKKVWVTPVKKPIMKTNSLNIDTIERKKFQYCEFYFINQWITNNRIDLLEIYLKYCDKDENMIKIEYYERAIQNNNFNSLIILYDNDHNVNKKEIVYEIIKIIYCIDIKKKGFFRNDDDNNNLFFHQQHNRLFKRVNGKNVNIDPEYKNGEKYKEFIQNIKSLNFNNDFYFRDSSDEEKAKNIFIDDNKHHNIKLEIIDMVNNIDELLDKRFKIIKLLENNNKEDFEKYVRDNTVKFDDINTYDFDLLTYSIEHNIDEDAIEWILNMKQYHSLNYFINYKNKYNSEKNEMNDTLITPFICAIKHNKFRTADLLLKYGYDINYSEQYSVGNNNKKSTDIIEYLYDNHYFNTESSCYGLMYLLVNGYVIKNSTIVDTFLNGILQNTINNIYEDNFEILLKFPSDDGKNLVKTKYYEKVITEGKEKLLFMLYDNDSNEKNKILYNLHKEYEQKKDLGVETLSDYIEGRKPTVFKNDIIYYFVNGNKHNNNKYHFLNSNKCSQIQNEIKQYLNNLSNIKNLIYLTFNDIKMDLKKYKQFISENNIEPEKVSVYNFDLLIHAIRNGTSEKVIKYMVDQYQNKSLNYSIEIKNINDRPSRSNIYRNSLYPNKITKYTTPFLSAIEKNNYSMAKYMLSKSIVNVNYEPENSVPSFIYEKNFLTDEKLKFLIKNGYSKATNLIKYCIYDIYCKSKEKYLRIIYNHFYYDNHFIINLLYSYKNRIPISNPDLFEYMEKHKKEVINHDIYDFLIENGNQRIINQILQYEYDKTMKEIIIDQYEEKIPHGFIKNFGEGAYYRNGDIIEDPFKDDNNIHSNSNEDIYTREVNESSNYDDSDDDIDNSSQSSDSDDDSDDDNIYLNRYRRRFFY